MRTKQRITQNTKLWRKTNKLILQPRFKIKNYKRNIESFGTFEDLISGKKIVVG